MLVPSSMEDKTNFFFLFLYSMVCDTPATHCPLWTTHCHAVFADPKWRQAREQTKRQQQQQQQQQQQPPSQVSATPRSTPHSRWMPAIRVKSWWESTSRRELPISQLLEAVTRVYPRESSPPSPPFVTNLRHYQKQSLAFMQDVENGNDSWEDVYFHDGEQMKVKMRGGWIASEVGMGKSAIVIALVASDPPFQKEKVQWGHLKLKKVKGTVIMTSSSLMGQWEDECKKHAPHLKVVRYHGSATRVTKEQLQAADIIISTATFKWDEVFCKKFLFRRHVMDESHLFSRSSCSAKIYCANRVNAPLKWCVTATPMTASSNELSNQCCFLRMPLELTNSLVTSTETLQKYMIRHIKKQVIDGCSALILPPSTTSFVAIPPSPEELKRYREAVAIHSFRLQNMSSNRWVKHYHLVNGVQYALGGVMLPDLPGESTKIEALRKDLIKMRSKDPNFRAVVFTQQRKMQGLVKAMVAGLGNVQFSCFDGASSAKQRDNNIRNFQSVNTPGAAVFCVTLRTGSVGITLTAATCVFLMEPCFNPVEEIQAGKLRIVNVATGYGWHCLITLPFYSSAAGRIHRLGQTKPVHVTKYVYKNTFEENVEELHQRVASGEIQFTDEGVPKSGIRIILKNVVRSGGTLNGNI